MVKLIFSRLNGASSRLVPLCELPAPVSHGTFFMTVPSGRGGITQTKLFVDFLFPEL